MVENECLNILLVRLERKSSDVGFISHFASFSSMPSPLVPELGYQVNNSIFNTSSYTFSKTKWNSFLQTIC